ncbi:MAG: CHAT domain-containing protein, partial [Bacteroidetes bacterium]|nr:CHAT domain-containing protein [Bacteroidota bacterium]
AVIYFYQSDIEQSTKHYIEAKNIFLKFPKYNATEIARVNYNLAINYSEENRLEEAIALVKNSLKIYEQKFGKIHKRVGECYSILGGFYLNRGELDKALDYFIQDKEICEQIFGKEDPEAAYAYFDCGMIYSELKDYYQAQFYFEKALSIRQKFLDENNEDISENYLELAIVYSALQKYDEVRLLCKKVISIEQQLGTENSVRMAESYYRIGLIDKAQFKYIDAIKNFNNAIGIHNKSLGIKNSYNLEINLNIAEIKLAENKYNEALLFTKKALPNNKDDLFPVTLAYLQYLKITQQRDLNKPFAIEQNKKYLEILIGLTKKIQDRKFEYIGEKSKLSDAEILAQISATAVPLIEQLYQLENKKEYLEWMYFFIENNKANALNSNLKNKNINSKLIKKIEQINAEIEKQSTDKTNASKIKQLKGELFLLKKQYELETKKTNNSIAKEDKNTVHTIQQKLNAKTVFLDYYNNGQSSYLLAITNDKCTLYKLTITEEAIKTLNNSIQAKKYDKELAKKITNQLIPSDVLNGNKNLIIAPDGITRNISFGALIHQNKYLIEQFNISHTFSGKIYFWNDNKKQLTNHKVLCIAPNYKQSNYTPLQNIDEIKLIQSILQSKILVAKDANIDNYNLNKDNFDIIHFSAHSKIDSLIPTSSAIIFQPDSIDNYLLKISAIIQQNIHTNLVSLNMCQGGFGRKNSGEGILNFAWAFQYAGAKNILVTRWNASDKVAKTMMTYFYENIKNKQSYEEAIRNAKLAY